MSKRPNADAIALPPGAKALGVKLPPGVAIGAASPGRGRSKYRNVRTEYRGVVYSSGAEARRAAYLDSEVARGNVAWWIGQPRFRLGVAENVYVADFLVVPADPDAAVFVEDVKGTATAKFERDVRLWRRYGPCRLYVVRGGEVAEVIDPDAPTRGEG